MKEKTNIDIKDVPIAAIPIAKIILQGFNKHYTLFRNFSARAKELFEDANWQGIQTTVADRITMYSTRVSECVDILRNQYSRNIITNETLWMKVKEKYISLLINHKQPELAETFFNSVSTKILEKKYYHNNLLFLKPAISTDYIDSDIGTFKYFYPRGKKGLISCFKNAFHHFDWKLDFADMPRDITNILRIFRKYLKDSWPPAGLNLHIQILRSPFYRNKCAYIFGRVVNDNDKHPFAIAILHNRKKQLYVDTIIFDIKTIGVLFSFSRAYFLVNMDVPSAYVNFLKELLPQRDKADFYTMLGLQKQSKNIFYRDFLVHLNYSEDKFTLASGIKGMVMLVFTLPSYPYVFKIIKDIFGSNKNFDQKHVIDKYNLVKRHDRVGRLADTLEYYNVALPLDRFDEDLLMELKEYAKSKILIENNQVIIKHVYIERRLTPLNIYLKKASKEERENIIIDYGNTIKELSTANIFPGDMLFKNFGVTRYKKLIFYDYDEIEYMLDCNFKKIPEAPYPELEMSDEVWYPIEKGDVFPEEFTTFLLGEQDIKETFHKYHKDLLDIEFWNRTKSRIKAGIIEDFFPYPVSYRFELNDKQKGNK